MDRAERPFKRFAHSRSLGHIDEEGRLHGVSSHERGWFQIIKDHVDLKYSDNDFISNKNKYDVNQPYDKESLYYREIFEKYYKNCGKIIPYFWKHPFCSEIDPSARLLAVY